MTEFTVDLSTLAGFQLDLQDAGSTFSTNGARLVPGLTLPAGTSGLMAALAPALGSLQNTLTTAHQQDRSTIDNLGTDLSGAATRYRATDSSSAQAISASAQSAFGDSGTVVTNAGDSATRFPGLNLPALPGVEEASYAVRQVITASIEAIDQFDEALSASIGMKPAADYLTPLVADWEALQAIGKRVGFLGINDYVTSDNLINGTRWLRNSWSGDAAQSFENGTNALGQAVATRSTDLDAVAKIIEHGGAALERLTYNQALGVASALTQPISAVNFTLPLGVWAQLIDKPMPESVRSVVTSAIDSMKTAALSRQDAITALIDRIAAALNYSPGRAAPTFNASDFEIPEKVVVDMGMLRYGYGGNAWWEDSIASAT